MMSELLIHLLLFSMINYVMNFVSLCQTMGLGHGEEDPLMEDDSLI